MAKKIVHIHIGPHKTGSSAIQRALKDNAVLLEQAFGLTPVATAPLTKLAKLLNADRAFDATDLLERVAQKCRNASGDCVLSSEDLSGVLPGTRGARRVYPALYKNLAALDEAFGEFDCRYYFFIRPRQDWIKSAYVQNLKHRQRFNTFESFEDFLDTRDLWDGVVAEAARALGDRFVQIPYATDQKTSAMKAFLKAVTGKSLSDLSGVKESTANVSPSETEVFLMERINRSSASQEAKRHAKLELLSPSENAHVQTDVPQSDRLEKPPRPDELAKALEPLWRRVGMRIRAQDQPNLMPPCDVDLRVLRTKLVIGPEQMPDVGRGKMEDQVHILSHRFRDQPQSCFLLGLTISYLRRDTPHTSHAVTLFHRLWAEEYRLLLGLLPTRWLISTFQTFLDHGENADQKMIGSGAYFFANMLKAYETERALEGLPPDAVYPNATAQTKMGFPGLDRFKLGGSDLLVNTNALLLELSAKDAIAGRVVQEFLARAKAAQTIFSRMDQSRLAHDINIKQFSNCWTFFDKQ